ncbi:MAG TPA: serine/threonine-protein kinase [Candidatus Acidoferrum sp.]|nr:serine/threonine-protein kinase [Candidatus Acidoferrum sp.]
MIATGSSDKRYELVERIAVGGMAEVFRARAYGPHGFEKVLAIKRILPGLAADPKFERRFIAEAKLAMSLNHANIVQVLDFSRFGQSLYIVMEYLDGGDLAHVLETLRAGDVQIPLPAALHVAVELLKGLDFAHQRGVVHRDVSPSNVLLSRAGEVKIADFGIAQAVGFEMSRSLRIMGKWRYMSPEQSQGEAMDTRSDVFSAGVVLYEILAGQRLFPGNDAEEIVRNLRSMPLPCPSQVRPDLPPEIDAPLAAALVRDRRQRTATAADLHAALAAVCRARAVPAMPSALARLLEQVVSLEQERATRMALTATGADSGSEAGALTEPAAARSSAAALLDAIIRSELSASGLRAAPDRGRDGTGRRTALSLRPPRVAPEDLPGDLVPAGPALTFDGATFVRSVTDADGTHHWESSPAGEASGNPGPGKGRA